MIQDSFSNNLILSIDAFVRSVGINSNSPHALFLGAGASISSGILSANMCIWQWKKSIFITNNPELDERFFDVSLESVRNRIQNWIDKNNTFPEFGSHEEYSYFAKAAYPISSDRQNYFQSLTTGKKPHVGYQYLGLLSQEGLFRSIWSTNFDGLTAKALSSTSKAVIEIGLDSATRAYRKPNSNEVLCISLHGDYRYDTLMNTEEELQNEDNQLRDALVNMLKTNSLIVSGYSGRDNSVLEAIKTGVSQQGTGRLYWCGYEAEVPEPQVVNLIRAARNAGREAYYVPTQGFDDILERLAFHILSGESLEKAIEIRGSALGKLGKVPPAFALDNPRVNTIIKSNAFEITCPSEILQFEASGFDEKEGWSKIRRITKDIPVVAGILKGKIYALGTIDDVRKAFNETIKSDLIRVPITEKELSYEKGIIKSLLMEALVKTFVMSFNLNSDGSGLVWEAQSTNKQTINNTEIDVFDAAIFGLKSIRGKVYLVIKPTIKGKATNGNDLPNEIEKELKRRLLTKQYNSAFNDALDKWRKILFSAPLTMFEFPPNIGSSFRFEIRRVPVFAKVMVQGSRGSLSIPHRFHQHLRQAGVQYLEPKLQFSNHRGDGYVTDTHQLRGIVRNQPYDYSLTKSGLQSEIKIGIICPQKDKDRFASFINMLHQNIKVDSKQEYLLDYPGFSQAFGIPVNLPNTASNGWGECVEPSVTDSQIEGASKLRQEIIRSINSLESSSSPNLIVIYVPRRWERWEKYEADNESFDLHDFIKAYCVQKGIATQFIREQTVAKPNKCEIAWWLAQSFYTKSMRTPWVLADQEENTAFAGLGFSLDYSMGRGRHVILGCSHIYGSNGQGLRYKLSKIENPIIRRKNPFMSRDDARRVGEGIRQLFFESLQRLPNRVVIHKRTPFIDEEKSGLLEGLDGVDVVDLLEINRDPMLRYVASKVKNGKFEGDGFPVKRGTTLVLENQKALIWVHGSAEAVQPQRNYYQGKSRIPSPLVVKRHFGSSSLGLIANEILGLSKMNWNTFDLYTKLPATIESSGEIARIGNLLDRFAPRSYDYRLFI